MSYIIEKYHGKYNIVARKEAAKFIVVHYVGAGTSALGNAKNNCIYFSGGNRNASAHYFIDDGSIYEYADPKKYYTWHVGDGGGKYKVDGIAVTNSNTIGIEVCMNGDKPFTAAEIARLTWLVQKLMKDFGIPASRVIRHFDASRKACPRYYASRHAEWDKLHAIITSGEVKETSSSSAGSSSSSSKAVYRVRKTWKDSKSQIGAYSVLSNAKAIADKNAGYSVFDEKGNKVYPVEAAKPSSQTASAKLEVDGVWGSATTKALQKALGTTVDGIVSGQNSADFNKVNKGGLSTSSWKIGKGGSMMVRALQKKVGSSVDGYFGPKTCKALQKYLGTYVDGRIDNPSSCVKELQRRLNKGTF